MWSVAAGALALPVVAGCCGALAALALHLRHLVQAAAQTLLPLEAGAQERLHQLHRQRAADDARAQAEHVHIVVLHALARGVRVVAEGGADAAHLVRGDAGADAAAADDNATLGAPVNDRLADGAGVVRVVHGVGAVGADVQNLVAVTLERGRDLVLHLVSAVVGADDDAHFSPRSLSYSQPSRRYQAAVRAAPSLRRTCGFQPRSRAISSWEQTQQRWRISAYLSRLKETARRRRRP